MNTNRPRRMVSLLLAAACAIGLSSANATDVAVKLTGDQEVPPTTSAATGTGTIVINSDGTVSGSIRTTGIEGTVAHIHLAEPGKNGPPIITLAMTAPNVWSVPADSKLTPDQYKSFKDGNLYVNVHSAEHKGGEIRTQLKP
jgi:CHRD domain